MKPDTFLILDFGGQYCHLIGRRIRENNVYSEVVPCNIAPEEISRLNEKLNIKGLILSGGPSSVYDFDAPKMDPDILRLRLPVLGICYGHQLIAYLSKGKVDASVKKEYGISYVTIDKPVGILKGLKKREKVWMSHGDTVYSLPREFEILAHSENCPVASFGDLKKNVYGVQWHPEVVHTEKGKLILKNFIFNICHCKANWRMEDFIEKAVNEIREKVNEKKCIIALSGGVDSSIAAVLAAKAIGKNLTAVFVDHGFMREQEPEYVRETFEKYNLNLILVNAKRRFLEKLENVTDPERKRKIIGEEFIRIFEDVAKEIDAEYLIQGTIYPDRIESGFRKHSEKIKSHHNVAGLPSKIKFKEIVEPLKELYKDEVRKVARALGLPEEIVQRQPFPGPGLAVRIVGSITEEKLEMVKKADKIVREEIELNKLDTEMWQYFAFLIDVKSTGVKGDARAYGYTIGIRAVKSEDAMTASFADIQPKILEKISTRITNEIPTVTRVIYDVTHKPPATIEWE